MGGVFERAREFVSRSVIESFFSSPGSYWSKDEFFTLSPLRDDASIGSFCINVNGLFVDHAGGDGGDFIDLVARAHGIGKKEAATKIIQAAGASTSLRNSDIDRERAKRKKLTPVIPIPVEQLGGKNEIKKMLRAHIASSYNRDKYGKADKIYPYRSPEGEIEFFTTRYIKGDGDKQKKTVIPGYYCDRGFFTNGTPPLRRKFWPYGVERLAGNDLPVLIVEGEKCANVKVEGFVVLSWLGGTSRVPQTDWSLLKGRDVVIFPDIDSQTDKSHNYLEPESQPGMKAAIEIKSAISHSQILDIYRYKPMDSDPGGWDIADAEREGINLPELIKGMGFVFGKDDTYDYYELYENFMVDRYGEGNIDQYAGVFFRYNKDKFFWQKIDKNDIRCDLQYWAKNNGTVDLIRAKKGADVNRTINNTMQLIDRHSEYFINNNPFINSGTSPWIHHLSGAIRIDDDGFEFHKREEKGEEYFKKMYPLHCLGYGIDQELYESLDVERDCPAFYHYVKGIVPKQLRDNQSEVDATIGMISQILAYCLSPIKKDEFFFYLTGREGNGKSFFVEMVKHLIGQEFVVERRLSDTDNRFAASDFFGAKVFVEPDMAANKMIPDDFIKSYCGNKSITIENKFESPVKGVKISIAMFIVSNHMIKTTSVEGINRRLILMPFRNEIKNRDKRLMDKIVGTFPHGDESGEMIGETFDERPGILALALRGWVKFVKNGHEFTLPDWITLSKKNWRETSSSAWSFLRERFFDNPEERGEEEFLGKSIYERYVEWCISEGTKKYGKKRFFDEIRKHERVEETQRRGRIYFRIWSGEGDISPSDASQGELYEDIPFSK